MLNISIENKFNNCNKIAIQNSEDSNVCKEKENIYVYLSFINNFSHSDMPLYEKEKINNYKSEKLINEKNAGYGLLKLAVKDIYGIEENFKNFDITVFGKPYTSNYNFSISHCEGLVCVALSDGDVGVDLECVSKDRNWNTIANKIIHQNESDLILNSPRDIILLWTKKEAIFKLNPTKVYVPRTINVKEYKTYSIEKIYNENKDYIMSIATNKDSNIIIKILN